MAKYINNFVLHKVVILVSYSRVG